MGIINRTVQEHPILVDKYVMGKEVEVDAVCDGHGVFIPGIMEHLERAGVHSGDSISVYPPPNLNQPTKEKIVEYTFRLAKALNVKGLINIQFILFQNTVYVIEVNPRSSRTIPYISKVTGVPIVDLATKVLEGKTLPELGYEYGLNKESDYTAVKMPVFSFEKLRGADISLGPEMKSTGEVLGLSKSYSEALIKAFKGAGINIPNTKKMIVTVKDSDKEELVEIAKAYEKMGFEIYSTSGTEKYLKDRGIAVTHINRITEPSPNIMDMIHSGELDLIINTPTQGGGGHHSDGFKIRRNAVECGVTCVTSLDTASALIYSIRNTSEAELSIIDIASI